jgi:hypothetical protein
MQREDFLLRMIAQMGRVLAAVRRMLLEGKNAAAGDELERTARQGGIDLRLVLALDEPSLEPLLRTGGEIDRPNARASRRSCTSSGGGSSPWDALRGWSAAPGARCFCMRSRPTSS